jgi:hypothetical protein
MRRRQLLAARRRDLGDDELGGGAPGREQTAQEGLAHAPAAHDQEGTVVPWCGHPQEAYGSASARCPGGSAIGRS